MATYTNPVPGTDHLVFPAYPELGEPFQPLLWIPKFTGNRTAFCSRNVKRDPDPATQPEFSAKPADIYTLMGHDDSGCPRCAPFENYENPNCGTGYCIIPIKRTLSEDDLERLGKTVAFDLEKPEGHYDRFIRALRSDRLKLIRHHLKIDGLIA